MLFRSKYVDFSSVLDYDQATGVFTRKATGEKTGTLNSKGYIQVYAFGKRWMAHRVAWVMSYGCWPDNVIDHINRVKTDNRLVNLRCVTPAENNANRGEFTYPPKPLGETGERGVVATTRGDYIVKKWDRVAKTQVYVGRAASLAEAISMRDGR